MNYRLRVAQVAETAPLSLSQIREHLNLGVDETQFDSYLLAISLSASAWAENYLNRTLLDRTYEMQIDRFFDEIKLPKPPTSDLVSVQYIDEQGVAQNIDVNTGLRFDNFDDASPAVLRPNYDEDWPDTRDTENAVTIQFTGGYTNVELIPEDVRHALLLLVGDLFENRENYSLAENGSVADRNVTAAVRNLLFPHRVIPIA
ncbi:MAG: hypothetical protein AAFX44_06640 [Pseudomonadota bacterium]